MPFDVIGNCVAPSTALRHAIVRRSIESDAVALIHPVSYLVSLPDPFVEIGTSNASH